MLGGEGKMKTLRVTGIAWMAAAALAAAGCQEQRAKSEPTGAGAATAAADVGGPAAPETQAFFEGEFEAVGVEPFWTLDLLRDWVSFSRLNLPSVGSLPGPREVGAKGMRLEAGPLLVTLMREPCVHTSGETYELRAVVRYDGVSYQGCARPLIGEEAAQSWAGNLPELLPAIDTCLARARRPSTDVTFAYPNEAGEVSVRLLDRDGGRFECIASKDGAKVRYFEAIGDRDVLSGEREPLFTRAPGAPPTGPCLKSDPAPDDTGYLTRRVC